MDDITKEHFEDIFETRKDDIQKRLIALSKRKVVMMRYLEMLGEKAKNLFYDAEGFCYFLPDPETFELAWEVVELLMEKLSLERVEKVFLPYRATPQWRWIVWGEEGIHFVIDNAEPGEDCIPVRHERMEVSWTCEKEGT